MFHCRVSLSQEKVADIINRYKQSNGKIEPGQLHALQEAAGKFAAMVTAFCERLGFADLEMLLAKFQVRKLRTGQRFWSVFGL